MDRGTPHCSVFELPLGMPGLKEFGEREGNVEGKWPTVEQWRKLFAFMQIDAFEWAGVRLVEIAAGAAAQAKYTGTPFAFVWSSDGCSDDRRNVAETCQRIGLNEPETAELLAKKSNEARAMMDRTDVWRTALTLAE